MLDKIKVIISILNIIKPQLIMHSLKKWYYKFHFKNKKDKLQYLWEEPLLKATQNAGISAERYNNSCASVAIGNLFCQSIRKGNSISNKDIALILARENCLGLNSAGIGDIATTFCIFLNRSIEQDMPIKLYFEGMGFYLNTEVCEIYDFSTSNFLDKLNNSFAFNEEYYNHFSKRVECKLDSLTKIKVFFPNERGANVRSSNYSSCIRINIFSISEISPAFFTSDADYVLYEGEMSEKLKRVEMDIEGNIKLFFENKTYGTLTKGERCIWSIHE